MGCTLVMKLSPQITIFTAPHCPSSLRPRSLRMAPHPSRPHHQPLPKLLFDRINRLIQPDQKRHPPVSPENPFSPAVLNKIPRVTGHIDVGQSQCGSAGTDC